MDRISTAERDLLAEGLDPVMKFHSRYAVNVKKNDFLTLFGPGEISAGRPLDGAPDDEGVHGPVRVGHGRVAGGGRSGRGL